MLLETALSMVTMVCGFPKDTGTGVKKVFHRARRCFQARLASLAAMFNPPLTLNHRLQPDADPHDQLLHIAQDARELAPMVIRTARVMRQR
ncbi:MAG: hypothetical protein GTO55_01395 [Armatimonadetes bacterium]|nr:hypothetical protein [Armatimonadota bacterium]NIM22932.1 hypothetical protein [Armatimonadota bacterium]NIM66803.1 hypothetical protein [Armatimonadota bacterium]NIN04991.1 hypothetical protein [Armatimonadota bacterium]NIO96037.1 hypothetical protein [Armatimonadota bacterium]